ISRVSDVVYVGQRLILKCIERDVRGNIKLSLKDTLPESKSEPQNITVENSELPLVEGSSSTCKSAGSNVSVRDSNSDSVSVSNDFQENQRSDINILPASASEAQQTDVDSLYSSPSVVIRSAAECDTKKSFQDVTQLSKNKQSRKQSQTSSSPQKKAKFTRKVEVKSSEVREKHVMVENDGGETYHEATQALKIRQTRKHSQSSLASQKLKSTEEDEKDVMVENDEQGPSQEITQALKIKQARKQSQSRSASQKLSILTTQPGPMDIPRLASQNKTNITSIVEAKSGLANETPDMVGDVAPLSSSLSEFFRTAADYDEKSTCKIPSTVETKSRKVHENPVLVGNSCTVRVLQLRTFGLVLQLANGDRGMLRFE
ncbi:hypothetical protein KI387_000381, partial [Taxus chinensis]